MKIKLLLILAFLSTFLIPRCGRADEKPQLFGTQLNASYPFCSPDGTFLAVSDEETNGFSIWNIATKRRLWKSGDFFMSFSSDEKSVMVAHSTQTPEENLTSLRGVSLKLLDARTGRLLKSMSPLPPSTQTDAGDTLLDYGFSLQENEFLLVTPRYLHTYDVRTGALQASKKWSGLDVPLACARLLNNEDQLAAYADGIAIFDIHTGALLRRLPEFQLEQHKSEVATVAKLPDSLQVSPDDSLLIEDFDNESPSRIHRLSDGKLLWTASDWPTFSPDGERIYISAAPGLDVFEASTGRKLKHIAGPSEYGFDISPAEDWLYEARDGKIYRWRLH